MATADVIVSVIDANDNCPTFVNIANDGCHTEVFVVENQPSGSTVAILSATDPDVGENGDVVYGLLKGISKYFVAIFGLTCSL